MSALEPGFANPQGDLLVTESSGYYGLRARGGTGLIMTGNIAVTPEGRASAVQPGSLVRQPHRTVLKGCRCSPQ